MTSVEFREGVLGEEGEGRREERRPSLAVVVLGVVALALLTVFSLVGVVPGVALGGVGGGAAPGGFPLVLLVGWNGTQSFGVAAPVGVLVEREVYVCNVADADVEVSARVVEAPPEVKVFLLHVNGTAFGVRYGNYTQLSAAFEAGRCTPAKLEVLIDAKARPNRAYPVAVEVTSHPR